MKGTWNKYYFVQSLKMKREPNCGSASGAESAKTRHRIHLESPAHDGCSAACPTDGAGFHLIYEVLRTNRHLNFKLVKLCNKGLSKRLNIQLRDVRYTHVLRTCLTLTIAWCLRLCGFASHRAELVSRLGHLFDSMPREIRTTDLARGKPH